MARTRKDSGAKSATAVAGRIIDRVIVTDGGDDCVFEWKYGEGITFPKGDTAC